MGVFFIVVITLLCKGSCIDFIHLNWRVVSNSFLLILYLAHCLLDSFKILHSRNDMISRVKSYIELGFLFLFKTSLFIPTVFFLANFAWEMLNNQWFPECLQVDGEILQCVRN